MDIKCEILLCFSNISGKAEVLKSFLLIDFLKFIEKVTADEIYIYTVRNVWVLVNKVGRCCATWLRLRNIFGAPTSSFYSIVLTPPYLVLVKPKNTISNNPIKWRILIQSKCYNWWQFCAAEEAPFLPLMTFFDPETNFFEVSHNLSTFGVVLIRPHMPPNAPEWTQGFFSNYKKIFGQNWVFQTFIEKK